MVIRLFPCFRLLEEVAQTYTSSALEYLRILSGFTGKCTDWSFEKTFCLQLGSRMPSEFGILMHFESPDVLVWILMSNGFETQNAMPLRRFRRFFLLFLGPPGSGKTGPPCLRADVIHIYYREVQLSCPIKGAYSYRADHSLKTVDINIRMKATYLHSLHRIYTVESN